MTLLDEQYWSERWKAQQTGWDIGAPAPAIIEFFEKNNYQDKSILIPGCGNAYEALALWNLGYKNITIVEIVKSKVDELKVRFADTGIKVIHEDFFNHASKYDIIIEHTFFCALEPMLRNQYAVHMRELLKENGQLVGLLFDRIFEQSGPPFGGDTTSYYNLFSLYFSSVNIVPCNNSIAPRKGSEVWLHCNK